LLTSSPACVFVCFLHDDQFDWGEMECLYTLICISFMAKVIECCFMYLLAICISSSESCLFNSFAHLLIELFVFLLFSSLSSLRILDINPLPVKYLVKIFFHPVSYLLILATISFDLQKLQFHVALFVSSCYYFLGKWSPIQKIITYIFQSFLYFFPVVVSMFEVLHSDL
jgi:hypothetical protein